MKRSAREGSWTERLSARIRSALDRRRQLRSSSRADDEQRAAPVIAPASPLPREWNLWELERRAREPDGHAIRDEEWVSLFVHLREYASVEGTLPKEFDALVRDSFADLIQAA